MLELAAGIFSPRDRRFGQGGRAMATGFAGFLVSATLAIPVGLLENARTSRKRAQPPLPAIFSIDVIIPAYLEAGVIGEKIAQLRDSADSLLGQLRVIVVASDEDTAAAAGGADLVLAAPRNGKAAAINIGLANSVADVIVLTDANCEIVPRVNWIAHLKADLGRWDLVSSRKVEAQGTEGIFWAYESLIKSQQTTTVGTLAVAGEFMAARRQDMMPIQEGVILDDFRLAANFVDRGLSVSLSEQITTVEQGVTGREQWERRVRMAEGILSEVVPLIPLLARTPEGRILIAHKVGRSTAGVAFFWLGVGGLSLRGAKSRLVAPCVVAYLVSVYMGKVPAPRPVRPLSSIVGMQAVPLAAAYRLLRRLSAGDQRRGVWRKIAR